MSSLNVPVLIVVRERKRERKNRWPSARLVSDFFIALFFSSSLFMPLYPLPRSTVRWLSPLYSSALVLTLAMEKRTPPPSLWGQWIFPCHHMAISPFLPGWAKKWDTSTVWQGFFINCKVAFAALWRYPFAISTVYTGSCDFTSIISWTAWQSLHFLTHLENCLLFALWEMYSITNKGLFLFLHFLLFLLRLRAEAKTKKLSLFESVVEAHSPFFSPYCESVTPWERATIWFRREGKTDDLHNAMPI